jgi:hypothetical protein
MYKTTITSGPVEVMSHGSVISYEGNSIRIITELPGFNFIINYIFEDGENTSDPSSVNAFVSENNEELNLILRNFKTSLGAGTIKAMHVGHHEHKKLFLNFRVVSLDDGVGKTLTYTLYKELEGGVDNG